MNDQLQTEKLNTLPLVGGVFDGTPSALSDLRRSFPYFDTLLSMFTDGNASLELKKKYVLKMVDEKWVSAIEAALPYMDALIRFPHSSLQEEEDVFPAEKARKITQKSVIHLSQHTDLISEIRRDGTIVPLELLNVYQEDSIFTYENKFLNTLLYRMYSFVMLRYESVLECGIDEKTTELTLDQSFESGEKHGKIKISIEMSEPYRDKTRFENYVFTTDLWHRLERIVEIVKNYMASNFAREMARNFVRPPVIRTNMLLKNVNFRACLDLWEFLESYDNTGYELLVSESLEDVSDDFVHDFYNSVSAQFVIFQKYIRNQFEQENELDSRLTDTIQPKIKDELDPFRPEEYDLENPVAKKKQPEEPTEELNRSLIDAINIALAADKIFLDKEKAALAEEGIVYKYNYSFLARLIFAQDPTQIYYSAIKNFILSHNGTKSKISWHHELFSKGGEKLVRLNVRGKMLILNLALNPADYAGTKYRFTDESERASSAGVPFLFKVKGERTFKQALELLADVVRKYELTPMENFAPVTYHYDYRTPEELLAENPPLVKLIGQKGSFALKFQGETQVPEEQPFDIAYKYNYSFLARLIFAGDETQAYYSAIKNFILSHNGTKSKISWHHELFSKGGEKLVRLNVRGKMLILNLALNPADYAGTKYRFTDESERASSAGVPFLFKVKGERTFKQALELLADVVRKYELTPMENFAPVTYHYDYRTPEELLAENPPLVKLIGQKGSFALKFQGETQAEDAVSEAEPIEVPAPAEETDEFGIAYKYNFSFMARLIFAGDETQEYYEALKNALLSYEGTKSKISWHHELFTNKSGEKLVRLNVRGKMLILNLALGPADFADSKYRFKDETARASSAGVPFLFKVKGERTFKQALELIRILMDEYGICKSADFTPATYRYPYESPEALLLKNPPLVKLTDKTAVITPVPAEELLPAVPAQEPIPAEEVEQPEDEGGIVYKYNFSFMARLIFAQDPTQLYYSEIKNALLSYEGTKSKISWHHELFTNKSGEKLVRLNVRGKMLILNLALGPADFADSKYRFKDETARASSAGVPFLFKVKGERTFKQALELIRILADTFALQKDEAFKPTEYHYAYETPEMLIEKSLVKPLGNAKRNARPTEEQIRMLTLTYDYSFVARLILAEEDLREKYSTLKNAILSYENVKARASWGAESFYEGRETLVKFKIRGKALCLYLALDPLPYLDSKYAVKSLVKGEKIPALPTLFKVRSDRSLKYALELIEAMMSQKGCARGLTLQTDYKPKPLSREKMMTGKCPLIRQKTISVKYKDNLEDCACEN